MVAKSVVAGARNVVSELAFLTRVLEAPSLAAAVERLAERARAESWTHEEFLAACLQREVAAREAPGGEPHPRRPVPERKSWEDFDVEHQRSLKRETLAHLGTLDFIANKDKRGVPRRAGHRQDPPCARARNPGLPGRAPHPCSVTAAEGRTPRR